MLHTQSNLFELHSCPRPSRRGASSVEVIVAFSLLTCVLTVSVQLAVRHDRLLNAQRDYRLALDELSNQLDRLAALPAQELENALQNLAPSSFIAKQLPGVQLTSDRQPTDFGSRLTLRLAWGEAQHRAAPLSMTTWILPAGQGDDSQTPGEETR